MGILDFIEVFLDDESDNYKGFKVSQLDDYEECFTWTGLEQYQKIDPVVSE